MSEKATNLDAIKHRRSDTAFRAASFCLSKVIKIEVTGEEINEPAIIAPIHINMLEVVVTGIAVHGRSGLPPSFMAKKELMWPPLGWVLGPLGAFSVDRNGKSEDKMARLTKYVEIGKERGGSTVIYPEGSRHEELRKPNTILKDKVRPGALNIAEELGMVVQPTGVVMLDLGHNLVRFGEAFRPDKTDVSELADRMQDVQSLAAYDAQELWGRAA